MTICQFEDAFAIDNLSCIFKVGEIDKTKEPETDETETDETDEIYKVD